MQIANSRAPWAVLSRWPGQQVMVMVMVMVMLSGMPGRGRERWRRHRRGA